MAGLRTDDELGAFIASIKPGVTVRLAIVNGRPCANIGKISCCAKLVMGATSVPNLVMSLLQCVLASHCKFNLELCQPQTASKSVSWPPSLHRPLWSLVQHGAVLQPEGAVRPQLLSQARHIT
jgi:hypothetical protein